MANVTNVPVRRGRSYGDFEVMEVTPAIAKDWLGLNTHNRNISNARVQQYARDMQSGSWAYTGDPIRFNGDGKLIDGQHRLLACIESGRSFETLVLRNLPLSVQEKLDQGKVRNAGDHLSLRGFEQARAVAAIARQLYGIKRGFNVKQAAGSRPTNAEVLALVDRHPAIAESVGALDKHVLGVHPSLLGAIHYIGTHMVHDRENADAFAGVFSTDEPVYIGDAAHAWRERLVAQATQKTVLRTRSRLYGTVQAWNMFRKRQPVKPGQGFRIPDEMPVIDDLNLDQI